MSQSKSRAPRHVSQEDINELEQEARQGFESILASCRKGAQGRSFLQIENELWDGIRRVGCLLIGLLLAVSETQINYDRLCTGDTPVRKKTPTSRLLTCRLGELRYWRTYLEFRLAPGGWHPLDAMLGLSRDGFSPALISWGAQLATQVSYACARNIIRSFLTFSPSTEVIESHVLGLGMRVNGYMQSLGSYPGDGDILCLEVDGKAIPTVREEELKKRRGPRRQKTASCCQRHRGKKERRRREAKKRRKKGDKSKNGRSATLMAMYTLHQGQDGKLHGPRNKKIWATLQGRKEALHWLREQATRRGFPIDTRKMIHIVIDGEPCLQQNLQELFPNATFCLDVRHLEEKLWLAGCAFHPEGSAELEDWVKEKTDLLYKGKAKEVLQRMNGILETLKRPRADRARRDALTKLIGYMEKRISMLAYAHFRKHDLPIATGIIEGAARYVVGQRLDCSGMRWIPERAEMLLGLRCIFLNGDWEDFFQNCVREDTERLQAGKEVQIRQTKPPPIRRFEEPAPANPKQKKSA
jgi:hypothetical protein